MPEYQGVDVEHPSLVNSAKRMIRDGKSDEYIRKYIGVPQEVVDQYKRSVEREDKKQK